MSKNIVTEQFQEENFSLSLLDSKPINKDSYGKEKFKKKWIKFCFSFKPSSIVCVLLIWIFIPLFYVFVSTFFGILFGSFYPNPKGSDVPLSEFSEARVRNLITEFEKIGNKPIGSENNIIMHDLLIEKIWNIINSRKANVNNYTIEVKLQEFPDFEYGFPVEIVFSKKPENILVYLLPNENETVNSNTLMFSCHYDTIGKSPGSSDDESGVSILLEVLRNVLSKNVTSYYPVLLLFTQGEEIGLFGASAFVKDEKYSKNIKRFINLESMASSGKSLMFRLSPPGLINEASSISTLFSNSVSEDLMNLVSSGTDWSELIEISSAYGFDFAFYEEGYFYHTKEDKLDKITEGSIQLLGNTMHQFLDLYFYNENSPLKSPVIEDEFTYYFSSFFSLGIYIYSETTMVLFTVFMLFFSLVIVLLSIFAKYFVGKKKKRYKFWKFFSKNIIVFFVYFVSYFLSTLLGFSCCVVSALISSIGNRMAYFGNYYFSYFVFGTSLIFGLLLGQYFAYLIVKTIILKLFKERFNVFEFINETWTSYNSFLSFISCFICVFGAISSIRFRLAYLIFYVSFSNSFLCIIIFLQFIINYVFQKLIGIWKENFNYSEITVDNVENIVDILTKKEIETPISSIKNEASSKKERIILFLIKCKPCYLFFMWTMLLCVMLSVDSNISIIKGLSAMFGRSHEISLPAILHSLFIGLFVIFIFFILLPTLHISANFIKILVFIGSLSLIFSIILSSLFPYRDSSPKWICVENYYYSSDEINLSNTQNQLIPANLGVLYSNFSSFDVDVLHPNHRAFNYYKEKTKKQPRCQGNSCILDIDGEVERIYEYRIEKFEGNKISFEINYNKTSLSLLKVFGSTSPIVWDDPNQKIIYKNETYFQTNVINNKWKGNITVNSPIVFNITVIYDKFNEIPTINEMFDKQKWMIIAGKSWQYFKGVFYLIETVQLTITP